MHVPVLHITVIWLPCLCTRSSVRLVRLPMTGKRSFDWYKLKVCAHWLHHGRAHASPWHDVGPAADPHRPLAANFAMDAEQVALPTSIEHIRAVIERAHVAISRANALTSEVHTLQRAATDQHNEARAALRDALQLDDVGLSRATYDQIAGRSTEQVPADRAEAILRRAAATAQGQPWPVSVGSISNAAAPAPDAEQPASGRSQQDVLADAHAAIAAASSGHVRPVHADGAGWAAIRQQYTDNVTATASLRRRQLRLRASQLRALRCLLTAEPQLAGYAAVVRHVHQGCSVPDGYPKLVH
jgi:hypothetical protein